jgi:hypothetical protein
MRVVYVAHHGQRNADDEGAIAHAFRHLGHEVVEVDERYGHKAMGLKADLLLFHKWGDHVSIATFHCPKVFWWFDLIDWRGDDTLMRRCANRIDWMKRITPLVDVGFLSDGDWVDRDPGNSGKLYWLPQGADGRVAGYVQPLAGEKPGPDVLFCGIAKGGGRDRISFVEEMGKRYRGRFHHVSHGVYREDLRKLVGSAKVVVAPDSPVTDRYWSNRVYNMLGFGAFLLHPYCERLAGMYADGHELVLYQDRHDLFDKLDHFLSDDAQVAEDRRRVAGNGLTRTLREHLYVNRVSSLLDVCRERGLL